MKNKCKNNHTIPYNAKSHECKECKRLYRIKYRQNLKDNFPEKYEAMLENIRQYKKTEKGKQSVKKHTLKRAKIFPEKKRAHDMVLWELQAGRMKKQPCYLCGNTIAEAHHPDYTKPLDVVWVCRKHHSQIHSGSI